MMLVERLSFFCASRFHLQNRIFFQACKEESHKNEKSVWHDSKTDFSLVRVAGSRKKRGISSRLADVTQEGCRLRRNIASSPSLSLILILRRISSSRSLPRQTAGLLLNPLQKEDGLLKLFCVAGEGFESASRRRISSSLRSSSTHFKKKMDYLNFFV